MARIKVKFTLNPGREGISWSKLSKQSDTIQSLLSSLSEDLGLEKDKWIARDFADGSYISNAELEAVVEVSQFADFNNCLKELMRYDETGGSSTGKISKKTAAIFSGLRTPLDLDEKIGIGLYEPTETFDPNPKVTDEFFISKIKLQEIADSIETETSFVGSIIGYTYEWNKGAKDPFIKIRDIATKELVKCHYPDRYYKKVAALFEQKESLVIVYGLVRYDWLNNKTEIIEATDFEIATDFTEEDYENFFGCAPNLSGDLTAAEYIALGRDNDD